MYFGPPPTIIETRVFSQLPTKFKKPTKSGLGRGGSFLEGPSFDRNGNLFCVDLLGRIFRIDTSGEWTLMAEYDGQPNGLKIHRDGRIFIADRKKGALLLNPDNGEVTTVVAGPNGGRFKGLNDLIFANNGDLYLTDQGSTGLHDPTGCLYRYSAQGELTCLVNTIPSPNGLVFNVRETAIYVAVTRSNAIWRVPLGHDSADSKVGLFVQLGSAGPDGMALDVDGNVLVAHPGPGVVWAFSKYGDPIYCVKSCKGRHTTNIAYGGAGNKTLYVVESDTGTILAADMPVSGKVMYSHSS